MTNVTWFIGLLLTANVDTAPTFDADVRPILAAKCFSCHGADASARKAELRLDQRGSATRPLASGTAAIVAGRPEESELFRRITSDDPDTAMPPRDSGKRITSEEADTIKRWIASGAQYTEHWAFQRPVRPDVPKSDVPKSDEGWARNAIDAFVLQRLKTGEMIPSKAAGRITLIRRLSFDLRGLPPSVEEVDRFVNDTSPSAYEALVERMMDSPHYGEKMAQDWLDLARYGDTNGYHADSERQMWLYRDYVVRAFNDNMPFDRFVIENIAGDLLPEATQAQRIASGFNRCVTFNEEGGADPSEYYVAYAVDRANTTGQVFLGMTFGCAQCHDHKYDPLSQKEYYQFYAFFNSVDGEIGAGGPTGYHSKPLPPLLEVVTPEMRAKAKELRTQIALAEADVTAADTALNEPSAEFAAQQQAWEAKVLKDGGPQGPISDGLVLWLSSDDLNGNGIVDRDEDDFSPGEIVEEWRDRSGQGLVAKATGTPEYRQGVIATGPSVHLSGSAEFLRTAGGADLLGGDFTMIAVLKHANLAKHQMSLMWGEEQTGKRRSIWKVDGSQKLGFNGHGADVIGTQVITAERPHICAVIKQQKQIRLFLDGVAGGQGSPNLNPYTNKQITIGANNAGGEETAADYAEILIYRRTLTDAEHNQIGKYLTSKYALATKYSAAPSKVLAAIKKPAGERTEDERTDIRQFFARNVFEETRTSYRALSEKLSRLRQELDNAEKTRPTTMVMVEKAMRNQAFVLMRGDFQQPGEEVQPDVPGIFPRLPQGMPRNRLALAYWLCDPEHPLVARVAVNRIWKQLMGNGLVRTMGDFGTQGARPSHPGLLDWLATEFVASKWNVKALQKTILMSATYRQSSVNQHAYDNVDPYNRLYSRAPRFRLSAEEVRDAALSISGLLIDRVGGPSVKPYQPSGYFADKVGRSWDQSHGDDLYRRGLYTHWRRTTLYPTFQIFDAPSREVCTVNRPRTNTPLQALVVMNDPTFVEAARVFGQTILTNGGETLDDRITYAFRRAVSRSPSAAERQVLHAVFIEQQIVYGNEPEMAKEFVSNGESPVPDGIDAVDLASWSAVATVLLNLDETITRE